MISRRTAGSRETITILIWCHSAWHHLLYKCCIATEWMLQKTYFVSRHHQIASSYWRTSLAKISSWSHHLYIKSLSWKSISRHITASFALSHHCDAGDNDNLPSGKVQIIDVMHESGSKDVTCWYNIWYPALSFQEFALVGPGKPPQLIFFHRNLWNVCSLKHKSSSKNALMWFSFGLIVCKYDSWKYELDLFCCLFMNELWNEFWAGTAASLYN